MTTSVSRLMKMCVFNEQLEESSVVTLCDING
jgi:hypothetical protein